MKIKKILAAGLSVLLMARAEATVLAEEGQNPGTVQTEEDEKAASYAVSPDTNSIENWPQGPAVYAASGIVMDMNSGAVLYAKKADEKRYPASITKLLSVLVALDYAKPEDKVTFSPQSIAFLEPDDANIGMLAGETLSMEDALYGMLLASANEVSYAVAENVGQQYLNGGYEEFIEEMNRVSEELGCTGSHWTNANGLHDENHYTTAHDMALIAAEVYQMEEFRKLESVLEHKIQPTELKNEERILYQNHKMLWPENYYYYSSAKAGKTGYTDQSKTTLVTMADNGELQLAGVVLHTYGVDAYEDTKAMFDYAFSNFKKVTLQEAETSEEIQKFVQEGAYVVLPEDAGFEDLEKSYIVSEDQQENRQVTVQYMYHGQPVGNAQAVLTQEAYAKLTGTEKKAEVKPAEDRQEKRSISKVAVFAVLITGLFVCYIMTVILLYRRKLKRRRERIARRRRRERQSRRRYK